MLLLAREYFGKTKTTLRGNGIGVTHMSGVFFVRRGGSNPGFPSLIARRQHPIRLLEWRKSVTQQQKEQISKLRATGASFGKIASALGMSVNTVKSYCKRNPISSEPVTASKAVVHSDRCPQCNAQLEQSPGHRQKRFCSPKCRIAWWAAHPEQMTRKKLYPIECQHCGGVFMQYGSRPRKFCSRGCYLAHRYGRDGDMHG